MHTATCAGGDFDYSFVSAELKPYGPLRQERAFSSNLSFILSITEDKDTISIQIHRKNRCTRLCYKYISQLLSF